MFLKIITISSLKFEVQNKKNRYHVRLALSNRTMIAEEELLVGLFIYELVSQ